MTTIVTRAGKGSALTYAEVDSNFTNLNTAKYESGDAATLASVNKVAITAPATSATLTIADGKTLTASNTLTFTGTDSSSVAFGTGGTVAYTGNNLSVFASTTSAQLAGVISDETGSGSLVFGTSPTLATPTITTSATVPLLIGGTGTTSTLTLRSTSGVGTTGADIIFQAGNNGATETVRILNNGNVGIGTSSPSAKLAVAGDIVTTGTQSIKSAQWISNAIGSVSAFGASDFGFYGVAGSNMRLVTSGADRVTIAGTTGNVGIGTTSPSFKLDVSGTANITGNTTLGGTLGVTGAATAASFNKVAITAPATSATITIADGKTFTVNNTITLSGTDSTTMTLPGSSTTLAGIDTTQTLTNKRVTPRITSITDAATITATSDASDQYNVTALAQAATVAAPSGTPTDGQKLVIRIKDNGTARALTWTTGSSGAFRAVGVTLPTTTVINKTVYIGSIWNAADSLWDAVAVAQEA